MLGFKYIVENSNFLEEKRLYVLEVISSSQHNWLYWSSLLFSFFLYHTLLLLGSFPMLFQCLGHTHFEYPHSVKFSKVYFTNYFHSCFQFALLASSCVHSHPSFLVQTIISYASPWRLCLLGGEIDKINQIRSLVQSWLLVKYMHKMFYLQHSEEQTGDSIYSQK